MSKDKLIYTIAIMMFTIIESGCTDYQNIEGTVYGDKYKACIDSINDNHFENIPGFRWDGKTATCVCNNVNCDADKVCNQVGQCDSIDCISDKCDGDNLIKCEHGKEQKVECKAGCNSSEIRCRECNDGDKRCKNSTTKEVCKNYHWEEEKCPTDAQYCIPDHFNGYSDLCDSRCVPGSDFCMNGSVYICDQDGKFPEEGQPCENSGKAVSCNASGKCGECLNEETQCRSGNHYYLCIDGKFQETGNCTYCTEGEVLSCIENGNTTILRKCDSNGKVIDDTENCKTGCNESRKDCKENTPVPVECVTNDDCADGQTCDQSTGHCMDKADNVCIDNAYKCNGKFLSQCEDNKWKEIRECPNGCENNSCKCPDECQGNCDENYECIEECPNGIKFVCPKSTDTEKCDQSCCEVVKCSEHESCKETGAKYNNINEAHAAYCEPISSDPCSGNDPNHINCPNIGDGTQICIGNVSIQLKGIECDALLKIISDLVITTPITHPIPMEIESITNKIKQNKCYQLFPSELFTMLSDKGLCITPNDTCSNCDDECIHNNNDIHYKCDADNEAILTCDQNGKWQKIKRSCPTGNFCDSTDPPIIANNINDAKSKLCSLSKLDCNNSTNSMCNLCRNSIKPPSGTVCHNARTYTCNFKADGTLESVSFLKICPNNLKCNSDGLDCAECQNEAIKCEDGMFKICYNGGWKTKDNMSNCTLCNSYDDNVTSQPCNYCENGLKTICHDNQLFECMSDGSFFFYVYKRDCPSGCYIKDKTHSCNDAGLNPPINPTE